MQKTKPPELLFSLSQQIAEQKWEAQFVEQNRFAYKSTLFITPLFVILAILQLTTSVARGDVKACRACLQRDPTCVGDRINGKTPAEVLCSRDCLASPEVKNEIADVLLGAGVHELLLCAIRQGEIGVAKRCLACKTLDQQEKKQALELVLAKDCALPPLVRDQAAQALYDAGDKDKELAAYVVSRLFLFYYFSIFIVLIPVVWFAERDAISRVARGQRRCRASESRVTVRQTQRRREPARTWQVLHAARSGCAVGRLQERSNREMRDRRAADCVWRKAGAARHTRTMRAVGWYVLFFIFYVSFSFLFY